jgi:hypothetical protein
VSSVQLFNTSIWEESTQYRYVLRVDISWSDTVKYLHPSKRFRYLRTLDSFNGKGSTVPGQGHRAIFLVELIWEGAQSRYRLGKNVKGHNEFDFLFFAMFRLGGDMQVC